MSRNEPYLIFGQPHFGDAEIEEVVDSLRRAWVGTGPKVARLEEAGNLPGGRLLL